VFPLKDDIPTRRFPVLTVAIIAICTAVYFLFEQGVWELGDTGNERVFEYGAIPYEVTNPGDECGVTSTGAAACEGQANVAGAAPDQAPWWLTIFTSMFLHGSLLHLGGNMLFLWIFGNNIEDSMGRVRFVVFYLLGGLAALGLQIVTDPDSAIPTVGASGAIAAVLGAYALLYPRARVVTVIFIIIFFTVVQLPALIVLGASARVQRADRRGRRRHRVLRAHRRVRVRAADDQAVRRPHSRGLRGPAPPARLLMARTLVLLASLAIICLLGFLTVTVAVEEGIDILVVVSAIVLLLLGFGVLGALTTPPPDG
jgi:membrane associated rhomboid family serine protease